MPGRMPKASHLCLSGWDTGSRAGSGRWGPRQSPWASETQGSEARGPPRSAQGLLSSQVRRLG